MEDINLSAIAQNKSSAASGSREHPDLYTQARSILIRSGTQEPDRTRLAFKSSCLGLRSYREQLSEGAYPKIGRRADQRKRMSSGELPGLQSLRSSRPTYLCSNLQ